MLDLTAAVVAGNLDLKVMARRAIRGITISGIVGMCGGCILPISLLSMVFSCKVETGTELVISGKSKSSVGLGNNYAIPMVLFSSHGA